MYFFRSIYKRLGLPFHGSLPGHRVKVFTKGRRCDNGNSNYTWVVVPAIIPNIVNVESFHNDWVKVICREGFGLSVVMPDYTEISRPAPPVKGVGHSFLATPHRIQRIAVSAGFLEEEIQFKLYEFKEQERMEKVLRDILRAQLRPLVKYHCVKEPPFWYNDYILYSDFSSIKF